MNFFSAFATTTVCSLGGFFVTKSLNAGIRTYVNNSYNPVIRPYAICVFTNLTGPVINYFVKNTELSFESKIIIKVGCVAASIQFGVDVGNELTENDGAYKWATVVGVIAAIAGAFFKGPTFAIGAGFNGALLTYCYAGIAPLR